MKTAPEIIDFLHDLVEEIVEFFAVLLVGGGAIYLVIQLARVWPW